MLATINNNEKKGIRAFETLFEALDYAEKEDVAGYFVKPLEKERLSKETEFYRLYGAWMSLYGAWKSLYGAWKSLYGAWKSLYGAWKSLYGAWKSLYGAWKSLYGAWKSLYGAWKSLYGAWKSDKSAEEIINKSRNKLLTPKLLNS